MLPNRWIIRPLDTNEKTHIRIVDLDKFDWRDDDIEAIPMFVLVIKGKPVAYYEGFLTAHEIADMYNQKSNKIIIIQ